MIMDSMFFLLFIYLEIVSYDVVKKSNEDNLISKILDYHSTKYSLKITKITF